MALALVSFRADGLEVDESVVKLFKQQAVLTITGAATDTTVDISNPGGAFWTAVSGTIPGSVALPALLDIATRAECLYAVALADGALSKSKAGSSPEVLSSNASSGGMATETLTVTGLTTTDIIVSVTQRVAGANGTALTGWANQASNALDVTWTADPGAGAIVDVEVLRESGAPEAGTYTLAVSNHLPIIVFAASDAPTSYKLVLEWELKADQLPVKVISP